MAHPVPILPGSPESTRPEYRTDTNTRQTPEVDEFCAARGLTPYLPAVLSLVSESFDVVGGACLTKEEDAETGDEWIEVGVKVRGELEQVLVAYDRYTDRWLASVPAFVRESFRLAWRLG